MSKKQDGYIKIDGENIYYQIEGQGDPLVLIHAGVADNRMWDSMINTLTKQYQVLRYDLRGFGRSKDMPEKFSNVEDLRHILDHFHFKSAYLVGISYGSSIALDFALKYPKRVKKLVMGAPSVTGSSPSKVIRDFWSQESALIKNGDIPGAVELNLKLWVDGPSRTPNQVDPKVRKLVQEMQTLAFENETDDEVDVIHYGPPYAYEMLGNVVVPTLVIVGALDLDEKLALAMELAEKIPNAALKTIDGAAHMVSLEKPEEFMQNMLEFFKA